MEPTPATLKTVIDEYVLSKRASRISERTLDDYGTTYRRFLEFIGPEVEFSKITARQVRIFLTSFTTQSAKTVLNYYIGLRSLWTWACREGYANEHIIEKIDAPKPEDRIIAPFSLEEIRLILARTEKSQNMLRDRAIILFLLDTGCRASELGGLKVKDLRDAAVTVFGKGSKERSIPLSRRAFKTLNDYLATRGKMKVNDYLFITAGGKPMGRHSLKKMVARLGKPDDQGRQVRDIHPHRFRHTFALQFLLNGGDAITLQKLLGHTSLDMVKKYVEIANSDAVHIHQRASPVENWGL